MRLIDADALIEETRRRFPSASTLVRIKRMITDAPTAYNVDAVVAELEREKAKGFYDSNSVIGEKNVWNKAIDIVRNAGKDVRNE